MIHVPIVPNWHWAETNQRLPFNPRPFFEKPSNRVVKSSEGLRCNCPPRVQWVGKLLGRFPTRQRKNTEVATKQSPSRFARPPAHRSLYLHGHRQAFNPTHQAAISWFWASGEEPGSKAGKFGEQLEHQQHGPRSCESFAASSIWTAKGAEAYEETSQAIKQ